MSALTGNGVENPGSTKSDSLSLEEINRKYLRAPAFRIWFSVTALVLILAGVATLYFKKSTSPAAPRISTSADSLLPSENGTAGSRRALSTEQLERMIIQASGQTRKEPKNASAWAMLAHSYEMLGKFSEAAKVYPNLVTLLPNDAQVLADYADVLAVVNGRSFKGEPLNLIKKALTIDPKNSKVLLLAGTAFIERQDYEQAISHLLRARAGSNDTALNQQIDESISQAKSLSGVPVASNVPANFDKGRTESAINTKPAQISGRVWLAESLRDKAPAQATLFLFARPTDGSRMPVALMRKKVSDLPISFRLDDSMAMVPNSGLSKLANVIVVARISIKGNVTPAPGDLEGISGPVPVGTKDLKLEISEVLK